MREVNVKSCRVKYLPTSSPGRMTRTSTINTAPHAMVWHERPAMVNSVIAKPSHVSRNHVPVATYCMIDCAIALALVASYHSPNEHKKMLESTSKRHNGGHLGKK